MQNPFHFRQMLLKFVASVCDDPDVQFDRLAWRAMSTVDAKTPGVSGPGFVGWHLPDEADVSVGRAESLPRPKASGRVTFLTLTDHFSDRAAPPPNGKAIYPGLFERADVIGFDTYPVEVRCSLAQIDNVYWMQRELIGLTGGKPTFQWIEAGPMEHCRENQDPTPAVVRAETWLAIAGGARGIGYFPDWWAEDIRAEVRLTNREILALALGCDGVLGVHDLRTRRAGTRYVIQLHLEFPDAMTLLAAHEAGGSPDGIPSPPMLFPCNPAKGGTSGPQARLRTKKAVTKVKVRA